MKYFKGNPLRVGSRAAARVLIGLLLCALCQVSCECSAASCSPVPTGLVGWWAAEGNVNDVLGLGNGSLQGGATASATGVVGQAFSLDGTNGYVQIPDSPLLRPANLTIEGWVRFTSLDSPGSSPAGEQYLVFKQNTRASEFAGFALLKSRSSNAD